jgi:hypothetical protein
MRNTSNTSTTRTRVGATTTGRLVGGAAGAVVLLLSSVTAVGAATPSGGPGPVGAVDVKVAVTTPPIPPAPEPTVEYEIFIAECLDFVNGCDKPKSPTDIAVVPIDPCFLHEEACEDDIDDFAPNPTVPDDDIDDFAPNPTVPDDDIDDFAPNPTVPDDGGDDEDTPQPGDDDGGDGGETPEPEDDQDPTPEDDLPQPGNNIDEPRPGNPNFTG